MYQIINVDVTNIAEAGRIHAFSWQDSHKSFCTPAFVATHTPERQRDYLQKKMDEGTKLWMLTDERPVGIVSVTGGLIEDLYVLPEEQNKGYGTALLHYAVAQAGDKPTLWILENNTGAERLYRRYGFYPTGNVNAITDTLKEIEYALLYDIRRDDLFIPGVKGQYTFFHISDSHLCIRDAQTDETEGAYITKREDFWHSAKGGFVTFHRERWNDMKAALSTAEAFDRILAYAQTVQADAILSTGDLMECMHGAGERYIKKAVQNINIPLVAAPGNHEEAVCNGLWTRDVQVAEYPSFRIVTVDNRERTCTDAALNRLEALCREGVPMILMLHIPLLTELNRDSKLGHMEPYYTVNEQTCDENGKRLLDILNRYDTVKLILCGHIHGYSDTQPFAHIRQISAPQGMTCGGHLLTVHG